MGHKKRSKPKPTTPLGNVNEKSNAKQVQKTPPVTQQKRVLSWNKLASVEFGTAVTETTLGMTATGEGASPRVEFPKGPLSVNQAGPNLRLVAPGNGTQWLDDVIEATIAVTPKPRTLEAKAPATPIMVGTTLSPDMFAPVPSAIEIGEKVELVEPKGGVVTAVTDAQKIRLVLPSGNYAPAEKALTIRVMGKRVLTVPPGLTIVFGVPVDPKALGVTATGEGPDIRADLLAPPLVVGQTGPNVRFTAPGDGKLWLEGVADAHIDVQPTPRTINFTALTKPVRTGMVLTAKTFKAALSAGADATPLDVITVSHGQGAVITTVTNSLQVTLSAPTTNYVTAPVTTAVKVEKGKPVLAWKGAASIVVGQALGPTQLNATITPPLQPTDIAFRPPTGTIMAEAGQVHLKASFRGNANFEAADPVEIRIQVCASASAAQGADAMCPATVDTFWNKPTHANAQAAFAQWDKSDADNPVSQVKKQGKKIMQDIRSMSAPEIDAYLDKLPNVTISNQQGQFPFKLWILPNGLQMRLKTRGDRHDVGEKKFCVEMRRTDITGFSNDPAEIAFKLTADGDPAPKSPDQLLYPNSMVIQQTDDQLVRQNKTNQQNQFAKGAMGATHLKCPAKRRQKITWALTDHTIVFINDDLTQTVFNAEADTPVQYEIGKTTLQTKTLPGIWQGKQTLKARAVRTDRFEEALETRKIEVKFKPK